MGVSGQPLSYNSPKRGGANASSVNESMSRSRSAANNNNSRMHSSPIRSPFRNGNNNNNSTIVNQGIGGLGSNTGKEFVLEELAGGDVGDEDITSGGMPQISEGTRSSETRVHVRRPTGFVQVVFRS